MPAAPGAPRDPANAVFADTVFADTVFADATFADTVFRVGRAYGMTADRSIYQAVAVRDGRITRSDGPGTSLTPSSARAPR